MQGSIRRGKLESLTKFSWGFCSKKNSQKVHLLNRILPGAYHYFVSTAVFVIAWVLTYILASKIKASPLRKNSYKFIYKDSIISLQLILEFFYSVCILSQAFNLVSQKFFEVCLQVWKSHSLKRSFECDIVDNMLNLLVWFSSQPLTCRYVTLHLRASMWLA